MKNRLIGVTLAVVSAIFLPANAPAKKFPGARSLNCFFASPTAS